MASYLDEEVGMRKREQIMRVKARARRKDSERHNDDDRKKKRELQATDTRETALCIRAM